MVAAFGAHLSARKILDGLAWLSLCLAPFWIGGCQSIGAPAPVENRETYPPAPKGFYRIHRGDTLTRIARWHGIPMEKLAEWNHLEPPYPIRAGALLRIQPPPGQPPSAPVSKEKKIVQQAPLVKKITPKKPAAKPKALKKPKPAKKKSVASKKPKKKPKVSKSKKQPPTPKTSARKLRWRWPLRGRIVQTFRRGDRTRQGVRIAASLGAKVRAAEAGTVIYSGSGLRGYGKLIILKHNAHYLSAYGFNRRLRVAQGARVQRGQVIAEVGRAPGGQFLLHFEIRRDGRAVNPLAYLRSP